jgi:hypothetical protein
MEESQLAHAVFRSHPRPPAQVKPGGTRRGSCIAPFYFCVRDVPLPAVARFAAPPEAIPSGDARGLLSLRSFIPAWQTSERFRSSFPHMPSVNFHLEAVFSRGTGRLIPFETSGTCDLCQLVHPLQTQESSADRGSSPRLLGIHPPRSPHLRLYQLGGAILPWD